MSWTTDRRGWCPICGERRTSVVVFVQARVRNPTGNQPGTHGSRARSLCDVCAEPLYRRLVAVIDAFPGDPPNATR